MMNNLFSIFNPSTSQNYSFNWISMIYVLLYFPLNYWFMPSRWNLMLNFIFKFLINEIIMLLKNKKNILNMIFFIGIFIFLMLNNFLSMFSYIFTSSAHLSFSLPLSLMIWLNLMLYGWLFKTNKMFYHLVPQSTPNLLMMFMVIIETISNMIRPGTLAVRLSANMIAGHLLMTLMSSTCINLTMLPMLNIVFIQMILITLELSMSIIQAYVFMILSILYMTEI